MAEPPFASVHISEIPPFRPSEPGEAEWKAVRPHLGVRAFGTTAYVARAPGEYVVPDHTEVDDSGTRHEELFFVATGHAAFRVGDEEIDAPAGTFVFVRDPAIRRAAVAHEAGTTVLAVGGEPGAAYSLSPWERKYVRE
jgi:mannose-6-phosphate isomerase-like protein (cupin superfamily)